MGELEHPHGLGAGWAAEQHLSRASPKPGAEASARRRSADAAKGTSRSDS